jgi:hypothetical protein
MKEPQPFMFIIGPLFINYYLLPLVGIVEQKYDGLNEEDIYFEQFLYVW